VELQTPFPRTQRSLENPIVNAVATIQVRAASINLREALAVTFQICVVSIGNVSGNWCPVNRILNIRPSVLEITEDIQT